MVTYPERTMAAMTLRSPRKGLHVFHNANSAQRVEIVVAAGADLEVPADIAAQLVAANQHFEVDPAELAAAIAAEEAAALAGEADESTPGGPASAAESMPDPGPRRTGKPPKATAAKKSAAKAED